MECGYKVKGTFYGELNVDGTEIKVVDEHGTAVILKIMCPDIWLLISVKQKKKKLPVMRMYLQYPND